MVMDLNSEEWEEYKKKVDRLNEFLFKESLDGRSAKGDMQFIRVLIHRFSSAKFFLGIFVGLLTLGVPAMYGIFKLIELLTKLFKGA